MTKKQGKIIREKKAAKPVKKASAKKDKPVKAVKKHTKSSAGKAVKSQSKVAKKAIKPVRSIGGKVTKPIKAAKPAKEQAVSKKVVKPSKPVKVKLPKTTSKLVKKVVKEAPSKEKKAKKEETGKTITLVVPVKKTKVEKPEKTISKKEKSKEKSSKKRKTEDEEEDVEIVDLWESGGDDDDDPAVNIAEKPAKRSKGGRKPKSSSDDDEPVIENDILIEQLINSTKRLKKPSVKASAQIRTFTNPMASLAVSKSTETKKGGAKKEPKGKFELEYVIRTSTGILYEFLTSPSELAEWFADEVSIHDGIFTFHWDGSEQKARLLGFKDEKYIRLRWLDKPDGTYFEFRIERDELTGDVSLIITDFADEGSDMQTSKLLWDSQVNKLSHVIGSY